MAASAVTICNRALARIGVKDTITDMVDGSPEATACTIQYVECRDVLLASFPWRFATKRATLSAITDGERDGWGYAYTLPSDYLAMVHVWSGLRTPTGTSRIPFATELNDAGTGLVLLSDDSNGAITYVARVTDAALFPPLFRDALSWLIASELAMAMAMKESLSTNALLKAKSVLSAAQNADAHGSFDAEPDSELITVRR